MLKYSNIYVVIYFICVKMFKLQVNMFKLQVNIDYGTGDHLWKSLIS